MAEELVKELEKFHLTKEEETIIGGGQDNDEGQRVDMKVSLMLVGKLLTNRPINYEAMKKTFRSIWRLKEGMAVRMVEANLFVFQFSSVSDKEKVVQGRPWFFDNQLLLLKETKGDDQISEIAMSIGESMGGFMEYDDSDPLGLENFMRLKVMINIEKPLRRGLKIAIGAHTSKWVDIKYERMGDFCHFCGKLGHIDKDCDDINGDGENTKEMVYKYGPWLRASPLRRNKMSKEESENEKMMLNKLREFKRDNNRANVEATITKLGPPSMARRALF
ncbi:Gag polyprotein [Bienertia sinuspersici]